MARWCGGVTWPNSASIKEWLSWVDMQPIGPFKRDRLAIITVAILWMIWRFRNSMVFDAGKIRKNSLFDSIVLSSFAWLKNRDSNSGVVWNSWLMCPL